MRRLLLALFALTAAVSASEGEKPTPRDYTHVTAPAAPRNTAKGYVAKTIGIKLRYDDFRIATRDHTAQGHTADALVIRQLAGLCLKRVPLDKRLRLLGVRASALAKAGSAPLLEQNTPLVQSARTESATKSIAVDQLF